MDGSASQARPPASAGGGFDASCSPSGTLVHVMAMSTAFDASCLAAPANTPFTIVFDNMDAGVPHNISIYTDSGASTLLFKGDLVNGPATVTYKVHGSLGSISTYGYRDAVESVDGVTDATEALAYAATYFNVHAPALLG